MKEASLQRGAKAGIENSCLMDLTNLFSFRGTSGSSGRDRIEGMGVRRIVFSDGWGRGWPAEGRVDGHEMPAARHWQSCLLVDIKKKLAGNLTICSVGKWSKSTVPTWKHGESLAESGTDVFLF